MTITVTDTKGNTWTVRQHPLNDPGAASAGAEGIIATTSQNVGALTTGDTITVSFGSDTPTAKGWALMEYTAGAGAGAVYVTGATGTGGTGTTSPTITTGTITSGDAVVAMVAVEAGTTESATDDADTSNGSWSAGLYTEIGSTTSGMVLHTQAKTVTGTATQTYNPTLGLAGDLALAWISIHEQIQTVVTPGVLNLALTTFAPTIAQAAIGAFLTEVLADSPTHGWRLGEASGDRWARDFKGTADGTVTGSPTQGTAGLVPGDPDTAYTFDGTDGKFVKVATFTDTNYDVWAVEFLYTPANFTAVATIVDRGTSGLGITVLTDGKVQISSANVAVVCTSTVALSTGTKAHVICEKNGATVKIWIDGVDRSGAVTNSTMVHNWDELGIGGDRTGVANLTARGVLDEVWYYAAPLGSGRQAAHFAALATNKLVTPGVLAMTLTTFAPAIGQGVVPAVLSLAITQQTPVVGKGVVPPTLALVTSSFAPVLQQKIDVPTKALALSPFAPVLQQVVTPGVLALALSQQTPVVGQGVVPPTTAMSLATFAPQIQSAIVPPTTALVLATFAPTVLTPNLVTPGLLALALSTFAPTVLTPNTVTPGLVALVLASFAPVLGRKVIVPVAVGSNEVGVSLLITRYAPTIGQSVVPDARALALTTFAPIATASDNITATPDVLALALTGLAPTVLTPNLVVPGVLSAALSPFAPSVLVSDNIVAVPDTKALTLTTYAPSTTARDDKVATPDTLALALTRFAPSVASSDNIVVTPDVVALNLTRFAPVVSSTANQTVTPGKRSLSIASFAPVVSSSDNIRVVPGLRALTITLRVPTVTAGNGDRTVVPGRATLTIARFAPQVSVSDHQRVSPEAEHLVIHTFEPRVESQPPFRPLSVAGVRWSVW